MQHVEMFWKVLFVGLPIDIVIELMIVSRHLKYDEAYMAVGHTTGTRWGRPTIMSSSSTTAAFY